MTHGSDSSQSRDGLRMMASPGSQKVTVLPLCMIQAAQNIPTDIGGGQAVLF